MSETSIEHRLQETISHAIQFLEVSQWPGGFWIDFELYVGLSNQWVTAYVAHCLGRAAPHSPALASALAYLQRTELAAGGWGYNRHVPPDGDSTANVVYLLARYLRQLVEPPVLQRCAETLAAFQSPEDGGFVTYLARQLEPGAEKPAFMYQGSGWTISHLSVTALAAVALFAVDAQVFRPQLERAVEFIRRTQAAEGYWEDHWWQDRIYGTYWAARFLATLGDRDRLRGVLRWLAGIVEPDGSWGNGKGGPGAAFYTALALSTLLLARPGQADLAPLLRRGIDWLLLNQLTDGSWASVPMLLTPVPEVLVPWQSDHPSSQQATTDQNRLFTTATVVAALARGRDWLSSR